MNVFSGLLIICLFLSSSIAQAAFSCAGPLTDGQIAGFEKLFNPDFSASLSHTGGRVNPENFSKQLSQHQFASLSGDKPQLAASATLSERDASTLKSWLNANAAASIPGWLSTALGIPSAWVGVAADVAIQLINSSGDAGRITLANVAGTVSEGGRVTVVHRVAKTSSNKPLYIWQYVYSANLNGKPTTFLLGLCSADVVVK